MVSGLYGMKPIPPQCVDSYGRYRCKYLDKIFAAPLTNLSEEKVVYVANGSYAVENKYVNKDWLAVQRFDHDYFNNIDLVDLTTGETIKLPTMKPKPTDNESYGRGAYPVISDYGKVWLTVWEVKDEKITPGTVGYDIASGEIEKLSPQSGLGERGYAIHISRSENGIVWVQGSKENQEVWQYDEQKKEYEKLYETDIFLRRPLLIEENILMFVIKEGGYDEIYARNLDTGEEEQVTDDKLFILDVFYEKPYVVWTFFGSGKEIKFKKWAPGKG